METIEEQDDRASKGQTTASEHTCGECGQPLTGQKERFCSDKCRMRAHRAAQEANRRALIAKVKQSVDELEEALFKEGP
jgi:predicted nucleic acid-binding Zn ribbon protein